MGTALLQEIASLNFFQASRKQSSSLVLSFYVNLKEKGIGYLP